MVDGRRSAARPARDARTTGGENRQNWSSKGKGEGMPDFSTLTERQREIYDFIRSKIEGRGYGPTVREIGLAFDIKSPNGVMCHLKALEKKGLIHREGFQARAIELIGHKFGHPGLPLLGHVAAGAPIEAVEKRELLNINPLS